MCTELSPILIPLLSLSDSVSPQHQFRVPGVDEEGDQVSSCDGRPQHPWRAEESGATGRLTGQDPEGSRRVPGEREGLLPKVQGAGCGKG